MKHKTLAAWLTLLGGSIGLHRFYLHGLSDKFGWLLPVPTLLGAYGIWRARQFGLDDHASWVLIPFIGFTVAGCAVMAIVYGLMPPERWNARHNPSAAADAPAGQSSWATVFCLVLALLLGTTVLMSSLAFSFQRYFEYQIEEARKISQ